LLPLRCQVPTQDFFIKDMGIPLSMEPDYETFECRFKFGKVPLEQATDEAFRTACFAQCPSKGALRSAHSPPSRMSASGDEMSPAQFEELCDAIMVDTRYDASVPSARHYRDKLLQWLRGERSAAPPE
jgi:hypothetical protein